MSTFDYRHDWQSYDGPDGTKPGCLPRESKPGDLCPLASERITVIPRREWSDLIEQREQEGVTARILVDDVLSQDGVGSCASEKTAGIEMATRALAGMEHVLLNPWSLYAWTSGGRDGGSSVDSNMQRARDVGIMPMEIWPRSKGWRAKPSQDLLDEYASKYRIDEFYDIQTRDEFASALLQGFLVGYGRRGHAIAGVEMLDEDRFLYLNSWGDWGDGGFGVDRLSRDINFGYGAFAVRTAVGDGTTRQGMSEMPRCEVNEWKEDNH